MKNLLTTLRESAAELKKPRTITILAMLTALYVVLSFLRIPLSDSMRISFTFLPIAIAGMLFGPVAAGTMAIACDILGYLTHPMGAFFPGFTLSEAVTAFIYGYFFYKQRIQLGRVFAAKIFVTLLVELFMNTLWLDILYQSGFFILLSSRIIKSAITFVPEIAIIFAISKPIKKIMAENASSNYLKK